MPAFHSTGATQQLDANALLSGDARASRFALAPDVALALLRVGTALLFVAHAVVRIMTPGAIPSFARFFANHGFPAPTALVWILSAYELGANVLCTATGCSSPRLR
jgi:uncharacterized membrane protein YphA (DoxX/SURF4 family)